MILDDLVFYFRWPIILGGLMMAIVLRWLALRPLRRLRWLPLEPDERRPVIERVAEASVIGLIASVWLIASLYRVRFANVPWPWTSQRDDELFNFGMSAAGVWLGVMWCAWKGRSMIALGAIAACLISVICPSFSRLVVTWQPEFRELQRGFPDINARMPIVIRCVDDTAGADVFINGERIGQTPCEITRGELVAVAKHNPLPPRNSLGYFGEPFHSPDNEMLFDAAPVGDYQNTDDCGVVTMSLNGDPAKLRNVQIPLPRWSPAQARWQTTEVAFLAHFPERERHWKDLLDQIRLRDYQATAPEWLDALDSFGMPGQLALQRAIRVEPHFQQIFDAWARRKYGIHSEMSADEAWQVVERIIAESNSSRQRYEPDGLRTRALELVAPQIAPWRLVAEVRHCLERHAWIPHDWSLSSRTVGMNLSLRHRSGFALDWSVFDDPSRPDMFRSLVLGHWLWLLSQSNSHRPFLEQEMVPLLLRYDQSNAARSIGGPVMDQFTGKHLRRIQNEAYFLQTMARGEIPRDWLLTDQSPPVREWRRRNEPLLFQAAHSRVDRSWEPLDFILEDFNGQADHRVWRYWQQMLVWKPQPHTGISFGMMTASRREWLWKFLDRLGPHAPVSAYVDAWKAAPLDSPKKYDDLSLYQAFPKQTSEKRQAIFRELSQLVGPPPEEVESRTRDPKEEVARTLAKLAEESGVTYEMQKRLLFERLLTLKNPDGSRSDQSPLIGVGDVREKLRIGELDVSLIRLFAESPVPEVRRLSLEFLADFPIPDARPLVSKLAEDSDASVRDAAQALQARFDELSGQPPIRSVAN